MIDQHGKEVEVLEKEKEVEVLGKENQIVTTVMRAKTGETEVTETMKKTGDEAEVEIAMMTDVEESHPVGKKILGKKKRNVIVITIEDEIKREEILDLRDLSGC